MDLNTTVGRPAHPSLPDRRYSRTGGSRVLQAPTESRQARQALGRVMADNTSWYDDRPTGWMRWAACVDADPELFFPGHRRGTVGYVAERYCNHCPVIEQCAEYGRREPCGIWGGQQRG